MSNLLPCTVWDERQWEGLERGSAVGSDGCVPAGQVIPTWLPFPDSEDHENLLRKGVTHILSVHNRAKPLLEVRAWMGGLGTTQGSRSWEGTPRSISWLGEKQCWIYTDLYQFTPIYTDLHRQCCPEGLSDGFGEGAAGCLGHHSLVFGGQAGREGCPVLPGGPHERAAAPREWSG